MKRILNIDDDPTIRMLVKEILQSANFEVVSAADGPEGLAALDQEPRPVNLACIILDVEMPGMSGLDVLTRLKLHADTQDVPVVMLTCQSTAEDVLEGYNRGAAYYITKPFTREQLLYGLSMIGI